MDSFRESVAFWATILATGLSVFGLIQSYQWLTTLSGLIVLGAVGVLLYARRDRQRIRLATITLDGRSIDTLNVASLSRRLNRSLLLQEAHQTVRISGADLAVACEYAGFCRAPSETAIEFSVDSENNAPFDQLRCFAYDLTHDPEKQHAIRPILIGSDGISKKIAIPFLAPVQARESFRVLLTCELPGCMKPGVDYYASTLSFDQNTVRLSEVHLVFSHPIPRWVRVYECQPNGDTRLLRDLRPIHEGHDYSEYMDSGENVPSRSARIYVFERPIGAWASSHRRN